MRVSVNTRDYSARIRTVKILSKIVLNVLNIFGMRSNYVVNNKLILLSNLLILNLICLTLLHGMRSNCAVNRTCGLAAN